MRVSMQVVGRPAAAPSSIMAAASSRARSISGMNAPSPTLTSSTSRDAPAATFFDMMLVAIRGMLGTVAVTSRSAYMRRSAGTRSAVWPATATPTRRTCSTSRPGSRSTSNPGIDSSLSSVPPV